jgi:MFS family permease
VNRRFASTKARALGFVLLVGVMSCFANVTWQGARSITGPYLASLGASAAVIGIVSGSGELLGYGLRLISGRLSGQTGKFWPMVIVGHVIQMAAVPLMALAGNWPAAAALIILERIGKATRNPPRDAMLSHAAKEMGGYGWAFGVHEVFNSGGSFIAPLAVAAVLALGGHYQTAFAVLVAPALLTLIVMFIARVTYPRPEELEVPSLDAKTSTGFPHVFWVYLAGAMLASAGFADFPLIAYHFARTSVVPSILIPVFYSVAMGVSAIGSLIFGRLLDRIGLSALVLLAILSAPFAPLVFMGGFWVALFGILLWGLGVGVQDSIVPAAVSLMVSPQQRAAAYGLFAAGYGIFWFLGSSLLGILYGISLPALIIFSVAIELAAIPLFILAKRLSRPSVAVE